MQALCVISGWNCSNCLNVILYYISSFIFHICYLHTHRCQRTKTAHGLTRHLRCTPAAETGRSSGRGRNLQIQMTTNDGFYSTLWRRLWQEQKYERGCIKLTTSCLEVWEWWNENLMEEEWTAVHFDGTREQTAEVVDVPEDEGYANIRWEQQDMKQFKSKLKEDSQTCSARAVRKRTLCLRRTFSLLEWWGPDLLCGHTTRDDFTLQFCLWETNNWNCFNLRQRILLFWWQMWWRLPSWYLAVVHVGSHDDPCLSFVSLEKHSSSWLCKAFSSFLFLSTGSADADIGPTLQWRTTTLWGSDVSHVSIALQTAQILSRGGAWRSGQP